MASRLAKWMAEGMPERDAEEVDKLWKSPCEDRRNSGMCGKLGCTKAAKGYHIACLWLARMATESCPAGHFHKLSPSDPSQPLPISSASRAAG